MNKPRTIFVWAFTVVLAVCFLNIRYQQEIRQKQALAAETRGALRTLMMDLLQARLDSFQNLPADGAWHDTITFVALSGRRMTYKVYNEKLYRFIFNKGRAVADHIQSLHIRRQSQTPNLLEVRMEARKNTALFFDIKVRVNH